MCFTIEKLKILSNVIRLASNHTSKRQENQLFQLLSLVGFLLFLQKSLRLSGRCEWLNTCLFDKSLSHAGAVTSEKIDIVNKNSYNIKFQHWIKSWNSLYPSNWVLLNDSSRIKILSSLSTVTVPLRRLEQGSWASMDWHPNKQLQTAWTFEYLTVLLLLTSTSISEALSM